MSLPKQVDPGGFEISGLSTRPRLDSICFLDSFSQPILYYRANTAGNVMAELRHPSDPADNQGIYTLEDNIRITGDESRLGTFPGMDFGGGYIETAGAVPFHHMAKIGMASDRRSLDSGVSRSFAHTIWNADATVGGGTILKPHRPDAFILISAGPDGIFGSRTTSRTSRSISRSRRSHRNQGRSAHGHCAGYRMVTSPVPGATSMVKVEVPEARVTRAMVVAG